MMNVLAKTNDIIIIVAVLIKTIRIHGDSRVASGITVFQLVVIDEVVFCIRNGKETRQLISCRFGRERGSVKQIV